MPTVCRTCKAPVVWAITETGRRMPLDAEPVAGGNIEAVNDGCDGLLARYVKPEPGVVRYVSHFATCPEAQQHRRTSNAPAEAEAR